MLGLTATVTELAKLSPVPVFVRTHNLLTTGDGTPALKWGSTNAYTEDAAGRPIAYPTDGPAEITAVLVENHRAFLAFLEVGVRVRVEVLESRSY